ncbi:MAG: HD domain-containing protein [Bacillota bacterium]|nr:HD domain-containing protein [Bacillota bacterium]
MLRFEDVKQDEGVSAYIRKADESLAALGYTYHSFGHVGKVAETAGYILETLGYPPREVELAKIAAWLHDIGNVINRVDHAQSGAVMAFRILDRLGADPEEVATIITAIGNHDEGTAEAVNPVAAALILGDKTDVRRSRVRNKDVLNFDIHDRVNYSVKETLVEINEDHSAILVEITIDTDYCSVMDYFEIFLGRMILCRKAAARLGLRLCLRINGQQVL